MRTDWRAVARLVLLTGLTTTAAVGAQEPDAEDTRWPDPTELALGRAQDGSGAEDIGWSNATELSVVRSALPTALPGFQRYYGPLRRPDVHPQTGLRLTSTDKRH